MHAAARTTFRLPMSLYFTTFLVVGLALSLLGPALTDLRDRTGSDIGGIGVLFVGQSAGYVVGSFLGGALFDRFAGHRVLAGSLGMLAVGLALVSSFDDLRALFVVFVLVGAGAAVADVGANTMLMWELGAGVSRAMNVLHLCFGIGALSAPLAVYAGLALATRGAAVTCVAIAAWAVLVRSPSNPTEVRHEHTPHTRPMLAVLAAFFFLYVGLEIGFAGWIRTYGEELDLSALAATWLTTTFWVGFTVGRVVSSAIGSRLRPKAVLAASCVATIVAAVVLVLGGGATAAVWSGTALMGLATAPQFPVMLTYLERRIKVTGRATAWFVGAAGLGGLVFPWVIGRWMDAAGATALPWAMLVLGLLTLGSFGVSNRRLGG